MATKKTPLPKNEQPVSRRGPKPKTASGVPMTPAERKALQRERDRIKLAQKQIPEMTLEALLAATGKAVSDRQPQELTPLFGELRKRAKSG